MTLPLTGAGPSAPGGYSTKVLGYSPIAYWPLNETSGTTAICQVNTAQNGTYARDVSTMGTGTGIGDGNTAPLFDGTNDAVGIGTATLISAFDGDEGSIMAWVKPLNAGIWTDGSLRIWTAFRTADYNDYIYWSKDSVNSQVEHMRRANAGAWNTVNAAASFTAWTHSALTWSVTNNQLIAYSGGVQLGTTQPANGPFGGPLVGDRCCIGSLIYSSPTSPWNGWLAHVVYWAGTVLTQPQIADLATV